MKKLIANLTLCFLFCCLSYCTVSKLPEHEHGLCRGCGREIIELSFLTNVKSPFAIQIRNSSNIADGAVSVQTVINPSGTAFPIVIVRSAGCTPVGGWYSRDTWFPNHSWSPCVCPQCSAHLGWAFRKFDSKSKKAAFFALIEDKVLRESFVDSLLAVPRGFQRI